MAIRIGRTLPPAAAPITFRDIICGISCLFFGTRAVEKFAEDMKSYFGITDCFLVSSGKAALFLILQGLKKLSPDRDEVLIPAYTCYSVPSAIVRAGLKIRICDIEPDSLDFDYDELKSHLSNPRLLCVLPTHLFGVVSDVPRLRTLIGERDIYIVEDAAQAVGAELNGTKVGTLGDVSFFSFGRGKVITTVEGGAILTASAKIGEVVSNEMSSVPEAGIRKQISLLAYAFALKLLIYPSIFWIPKMIPFLRLGETHFEKDFHVCRFSSFQAGLANGWQEKISRFREIRKSNSLKLLRFAINSPITSSCLGVIRFPLYLSSNDKKQEVLNRSNKLGLGISDGYPDTVNKVAEVVNYIAGGLADKAQSISSRLVTLPVHPYVKDKDITDIALLLKSSGELPS